jgi:hypothetical protein
VVGEGRSLAVLVVGCVLWGAGVALGFPVGMSAAADDPVRATPRVSVVATIGYTAFLVGPVSIGVLGDHTGVAAALLLVVGFLAVALAAAAATRPPSPADERASARR